MVRAISKIANLSTFEPSHPDTTGTSDDVIPSGSYTYDRSGAKEAIINDIGMFNLYLAELQGRVVPRFLGSWRGLPLDSGGLEVVIVVMEYVGPSRSTEELRKLAPAEKYATRFMLLDFKLMKWFLSSPPAL
jgi:hypothetical protein